MPVCGTFEYVVVVPPTGNAGPWNVHVSKAIEITGDDLRDDRLVGHSPVLTISDAGISAETEASSLTGMVAPRVARSRLTLTARHREYARVQSAAFHVDQRLVAILRAGDQVFMARTNCGSLGLSVVRDHRLVAAVGAVSSVPLGEGALAGTPLQPVMEAEAIFRKRDSTFKFRELPVEIRLGADVRLLYRGQPRLNVYEVFVEHGFYPGLPGTGECVAIWRRDACPSDAAIASAQILDRPNALGMTEW